MGRGFALVALAFAISCGSTNPPAGFSKREWREIQALQNQSTPGEIVSDGGYVLQNLVTPIIQDQRVVPIYTVQLFMMVDTDGVPKVGIVPKYVQDHSDWLWRECHETSLWKSDPWTSGPNIARDDGHWMYVEAVHNGNVDVASHGRYEWVSFRVSRDTLRELAAADRSGGQVCKGKFEFSAEQKSNIASFANHSP